MQPRRTSERSGRAMIGSVGDRDPAYRVHGATEDALAHAPAALAFQWVPTDEIAANPQARLARYAGLLIAPGSPYRSMEGALAAIRHAREHGVPLLGTCGGFQHMVVEYARHVLGITDADHEETNPSAANLAVTALACSLAGQDHPVNFVSGTRAAAVYRAARVVEPFFCSFGLSPNYRPLLEQHGLVVSGVGDDDEVRVLELLDHPFFLGTLYVPQARSTPARPHPLVTAFVAVAGAHALASA